MLQPMNETPLRLLWPDFIYELAELIRASPNPPPVYIVGGAARDAYLGREIGDIDIAVDGDAIALARRVTDAWGADIYIMDRERGVARVFFSRGGHKFSVDFANLRGPTLEADLRDRDFSMNAMAADLLRDPGRLIDPLGAAADLKMKILRRCSLRSIANDPVRALRAVRLSVQFDLKIEPDTAQDIRQSAGELRHTSPERIRDEFFKLLSLEKAARGLRVLGHMRLLDKILPGIAIGSASLPTDSVDSDSYAVVERMSAIMSAISSRRSDNTAAAFELGMLVIQLDRFRSALGAHIEQEFVNGRRRAALLALAALLHKARVTGSDRGVAQAAAAKAAASLRLAKVEGRILCAAVGRFRQITERQTWSRLDAHRFWHELGAGGIDAILLAMAGAMGQGSKLNQQDWLKLVELATNLLDVYFNRFDEVVKPKPLLDGVAVQELLEIGPGPQIGRLLTALREAQVTGLVQSVEQAREFVLRSAAGDSAQHSTASCAQVCRTEASSTKR